jgi:hypothetical protein
MVDSRFYDRVRARVSWATLAVALVFAMALNGTATASSTAVTADSANAIVSGASSVTMSFPFERAGDLGFDIWLRYETENGTAVAGSDYDAASGSLRVPAGTSAESLPVQVLGRSSFSPDKQFTLKLLSATGIGPTPSFAERVKFDAGGSFAGRAKVADINGDGKPDLVVPNKTTVSVLLNTTAPGASTPSFATPQSFTVGSNAEVATPTDVNGDGLPDLVVTNEADDDFSVLLNTTTPGASTPSFASQQVFAAGRGPKLPVLEDVNGDGRPDLVLANDQFDEQAISVFFNTTPPGASTVSFQARQHFEIFAPGFILPADVNGDGRPDLIVSSQAGANEVLVFLNTTPPGASDLSLDSEGGFPVGETPNAVRAADVNDDGRPDLVVSNLESNSVSVLLNGTAPGASTPSFAPQRSFAVGTSPRSLQTVDLNGDGRIDVVAANVGNHSASVLLNTTAPGASTPSFATQTLQTEPVPFGVVTADLNGDGRQDLIYTRETMDKLLVSLNTTGTPTAAAPSLAAQQQSAAGEHPSSVTTADLNGDGRPDLLVANEEADTASVLLNTTAPGASTPSFATQQSFAAGEHPSSVTTADLNGDGASDVITADAGDDEISALLDTQYAVSVGPTSVTGTIHYAIPQATLSSGQLAFGGQVLGSGATKTITVSNVGGASLKIEDIAIGGASAAEFGQASTCPPTLEPGSSCSIGVTFAPNATGSASAALTMTSNTSSSPDTVALSGLGVAGTPSSPLPHTLTVRLEGGGKGSVAGGAGAISCPTLCSHAFADGTQVTLTATPASGSTFAGWSGGDCRDTRPCRVTVGSDTALSASFVKAPSAGARLRIGRAQERTVSSGLRIDVRGRIASGAGGVVGVTARIHVRGRWVSVSRKVKIDDGSWHAQLALGSSVDQSSPVYLRARFGGSPGFRRGHAKRRLMLR